ncbi:MAG: hypothetical protein ACRCWG_06305 [Sarcina sp.]
MEDLKKYLNSIGRILTPIGECIAPDSLEYFNGKYKVLESELHLYKMDMNNSINGINPSSVDGFLFNENEYLYLEAKELSESFNETYKKIVKLREIKDDDLFNFDSNSEEEILDSVKEVKYNTLQKYCSKLKGKYSGTKIILDKFYDETNIEKFYLFVDIEYFIASTNIDKSIAKTILSKYVEYYKKDVSSLIRDSYKYIIDRKELCSEIGKF